MNNTERIEARLREIEAYEKAATSGPWRVEHGVSSQGYYKTGASIDSPTNDIVSRGSSDSDGSAFGVDRDEDAVFIAQARTDLPALLAVAREAAELAYSPVLAFDGAKVETLLAALNALAGPQPPQQPEGAGE